MLLSCQFNSEYDADGESDAEDVVPRKRKYRFRERRLLNLANTENEAGFKKLFRMPREIFKKLLEEYGQYLPPGLSTNGKSIMPSERLLAYLYFLGTNLQYYHSGTNHGLSEGGTAESISAVNEVLFNYLVPDYIRDPTPAEAREEARLFGELADFPPIIWGSIDGTHCEVRGPGGNVNEKYRCRHHYVSLNTLVVVGASGRFYFVDSQSPGEYCFHLITHL